MPGNKDTLCTLPWSILQGHLNFLILYFVIKGQAIQGSDCAFIQKNLLGRTLMRHWEGTVSRAPDNALPETDNTNAVRPAHTSVGQGRLPVGTAGQEHICIMSFQDEIHFDTHKKAISFEH